MMFECRSILGQSEMSEWYYSDRIIVLMPSDCNDKGLGRCEAHASLFLRCLARFDFVRW
jgi:hypothetical protein